MILTAPRRRVIGMYMELSIKNLRNLIRPLEWDDSGLAGFANIIQDIYVTYYIIYNEREERYDCFLEVGRYMQNEEDYESIDSVKTHVINEEDFLETLK